MVSEMQFSTVNDPKTALEGRTNSAPRGALEIIEQLATVRNKIERAARPGVHVSGITYCPAFGAARDLESEASAGPEDLYYNRDTDSKMLIGTWVHLGFQKWFLDHLEWAYNLTDEEIDGLNLPDWLRDDLNRLRAEGGEWDAEVPVELPEIGLVGTIDLRRKPDPSRGIPAAVIDIKAGGGRKERDRAHHIQVSTYARACWPDIDLEDVEMGLQQVRYFQQRGWKNTYWLEKVIPVGLNLTHRVRQYLAAKRSLEADECPDEKCFDVPKKKGDFKPTTWQCREPYCRCVPCPHRIPLKVTEEE